MKRDRPLEKMSESKFREYVRKDNNEYFKLNVMGRRGWPDRMVFMDNARILWLEFKREGEGLRKLQEYIHRKLRKKGHVVYTVYSFEEAVAIYNKVRGSQVPKQVS